MGLYVEKKNIYIKTENRIFLVYKILQAIFSKLKSETFLQPFLFSLSLSLSLSPQKQAVK
jgi:hypothetical protein